MNSMLPSRSSRCTRTHALIMRLQSDGARLALSSCSATINVRRHTQSLVTGALSHRTYVFSFSLPRTQMHAIINALDRTLIAAARREQHEKHAYNQRLRHGGNLFFRSDIDIHMHETHDDSAIREFRSVLLSQRSSAETKTNPRRCVCVCMCGRVRKRIVRSLTVCAVRFCTPYYDARTRITYVVVRYHKRTPSTSQKPVLCCVAALLRRCVALCSAGPIP